jgi:hypothetical protein
MRIEAEQQLRSRLAALPLEWIQQARGSFEGDRKEDYADLISAAHIVADEARLALHRWIDAGRRAGLSWAEIGATLRISKQAAQQRFGVAGDEDEGGEGGDIRVRLGATAFNEMRMLEQEGRNGRELVGTGAFTLYFRQTPRRWEYRRVAAASLDAAETMLRGQGWTHVSSWFLFHYFKRPLAAPEV